MLDSAALHVRQRLRQDLTPESAAVALAALWRAGEQLAANVRTELALTSAALDLASAMKRG
jgi:hypothetical protein